jgi:hypothetical protein
MDCFATGTVWGEDVDGGCDHRTPKAQFTLLFRDWGYLGFNIEFDISQSCVHRGSGCFQVLTAEPIHLHLDSSFKQQGMTTSCHIVSNTSITYIL